MKRSKDKFARLRLKSVDNIAIRSPIAKFFNTPPEQVSSVPPGRFLNLDPNPHDLENEPGPSNREITPPLSSISTPPTLLNNDFQQESPTKTFKKPAVPIPVKTRAKTKARSKKATAQPDIRKVLGISPELDYKDEEKLQRMILQKGREENMNADDLQIALAMSKSMKDQNGGSSDEPSSTSRKKGNKRAVVDFFEMLGMNSENPKKRTRRKATTKISLLANRNEELENAKIQSKIEGIITATCSNDGSVAGTPTVKCPEFPICSCYLFDMRVKEQRIMPMNVVADEMDCEQMLESYYVTSKLFAETKIPAGYLLRDWSKIPGRSPSPARRDRRVRESLAREDALEEEIEKELEAINKQSEAFLQNFDWQDRTASPDLFADLSGASERSMVVQEEVDHSENINEKDEPENVQDGVKDGDSRTLEVEKEQIEKVTNSSSQIEVAGPDQSVDVFADLEESGRDSPEMEAPVDLTQESEGEEEVYQSNVIDVTYEIEITEESPVKTKDNAYDPNSIDAILARARSLIDDLNRGQDEETASPAKDSPKSLQGSPENEKIASQKSPEKVNKSARIRIPSICIIEDSDEDVDNEAGPSYRTPSKETTLGASVLNGLSKIDWSKDQFSIEIKSNGVKEGVDDKMDEDNEDIPKEESPVKDQISQTELNHLENENNDNSYEYPEEYPVFRSPSKFPVWNDNDYEHLEEPYQSQNQSQVSCTSDVIDLCDEDDGNEDDNLEKELEGYQFTQPSPPPLIDKQINSNDKFILPTLINKEDSIIIKTTLIKNTIHSKGDEQKLLNTTSPSKSPLKISSKSPSTSSSSTNDIPISQLIIRTECVTPPPDYKSMSPTDIKGALEKYGIKTMLPPKNAITLLQHIYTQLHPLIADDVDLDDLQSNPLNSTIRDLQQQLGVETVPDQIMTQRSTQDQQMLKTMKPKITRAKGATSTSTKRKASCELPLEIAFKNRLQFDREYHERILQYKPIELKELMAFFKSISVKYDCNDVIALLDQHCITYRTVEQQSQEPRKEKRTKQS